MNSKNLPWIQIGMNMSNGQKHTNRKTCLWCGKKFNKLRDLKSHHNQVHKGKPMRPTYPQSQDIPQREKRRRSEVIESDDEKQGEMTPVPPKTPPESPPLIPKKNPLTVPEVAQKVYIKTNHQLSRNDYKSARSTIR